MVVFRSDVADVLSSVHHKVSDTTEVGLTSRYNLQTSNVALGLVGKYTLDDGAVLKVRTFTGQSENGLCFTF